MPFLDLEKAAGLGDSLLGLSVDLNSASTTLYSQGQVDDSALGGVGLLTNSYLPILEALTQRISDLGAAMEADGTAVLLCVSLYDQAMGGVQGG